MYTCSMYCHLQKLFETVLKGPKYKNERLTEPIITNQDFSLKFCEISQYCTHCLAKLRTHFQKGFFVYYPLFHFYFDGSQFAFDQFPACYQDQQPAAKKYYVVGDGKRRNFQTLNSVIERISRVTQVRRRRHFATIQNCISKV